MRVLVTGGLGLVGRSVVRELLFAGHMVRLFDVQSAGNLRRLLHRLPAILRRPLRRAVRQVVRKDGGDRVNVRGMELDVVRGDLRNIADVGEAVRHVDAVIHLGAVIPPAADRYPVDADYVNRGGTENIVAALRRNTPSARLIFASSVAVYGDRRKQPCIRLNDQPNPNANDHYAIGKLAAENAIRESGLDWSIFRLSAIVSPEKLKLDPLMYEMPWETKVEFCIAEDAATALARAVVAPGTSGKTFHIAGGEACRTTFGEYVDRITEIMGLGLGFFPPEAFGPGPFHCGYMQTTTAQDLLAFQNHSLDEYFEAVNRKVAWKRPFLRLLRGLLRSHLLTKSPYWQKYKQGLSVRGRCRVRFG